MKTHLFESFAEMVNGLPAAGILKAVELEHRMLENDLLYQRGSETCEITSVLSFCQFIGAVVRGDDIFPIELPARHVAFYRDVVKWLIAAGELPADAKEQFDSTFSSGFFKALAN